MIKLYEHPLSPYAQKVKLALYEKGLPFTAEVPDIFGGTSSEFVASNPRQEVPSLIDGEVHVFDSTVILEYLEDKWPQPAMLPATAQDRARVRMLEDLCDTYFEAINWALAEIRVFGRAKGEQAEQLVARAGKQIGGMYQRLERELGARTWFNGERFGWGDLSVWPYVTGSVGQGFPPSSGSRLAGWLERANQRDSTVQCMTAAAAALAGFQNLEAIVEQGLFKREYRDHRLEWMMRSGGVQIVLDGMAKGNIRFAHELT
ncbi:MAG: glutathione S-transferase family protein [Deltaproteobacteria bacterium]|nr:glutathione S-transferase family protein [Deltaproteobacteria bacterium]